MANNRDPQKSYRVNRRGRRITTSATRGKRVKQSSVPKPTSSSTRSRGSGTGSKKVTSDKDRVVKRPTSGPPRGAQGPRNPPQQGPSRRTPNVIGSKPSTSSKPPTQGPPKAPTDRKFSLGRGGKTATPTKGGRSGSNGIKTTLAAGMVTALTTGSLRNPVTKAKSKEKVEKAKQSVGKYNTRDADGTVRSRMKVGPKKVGPKKVGPGKVGTVAQAFDKAFAAAKKSGKKTFTFKGKTYTTKTK